MSSGIRQSKSIANTFSDEVSVFYESINTPQVTKKAI
jgi:hypothetical protein